MSLFDFDAFQPLLLQKDSGRSAPNDLLNSNYIEKIQLIILESAVSSVCSLNRSGAPFH
jgi:hypothetical protein